MYHECWAGRSHSVLASREWSRERSRAEYEIWWAFASWEWDLVGARETRMLSWALTSRVWDLMSARELIMGSCERSRADKRTSWALMSWEWDLILGSWALTIPLSARERSRSLLFGSRALIRSHTRIVSTHETRIGSWALTKSPFWLASREGYFVSAHEPRVSSDRSLAFTCTYELSRASIGHYERLRTSRASVIFPIFCSRAEAPIVTSSTSEM